MDKNTIIAVVVAVVIAAALFIAKRVLVKKYTMKLMGAIITDEQEFLNLVDSFMVKMLFQPFNREYMRLNCYIANGADKKVKEQISLMDQMRVASNQRFAVYQTALQYFISTNDKSNAKNMQRKMNAFIDENNMDASLKEDINMDIKMYFDKDLSTISYIDEKLQDCSDAQKAVWNLKKAYVLKANDKLDEAVECMKIVVEYTTDPTQKQIMQELVDNRLKDL